MFLTGFLGGRYRISFKGFCSLYFSNSQARQVVGPYRAFLIKHTKSTSEFFWKQLQLNLWRDFFSLRILSTVMRISEKYPATWSTLWFSSSNREMSLISQDFSQGHICRGSWGSLSYTPVLGRLLRQKLKREILEGFYLQSYPGFKKLTTTLFLLQVSDNCSKSISLLTLGKWK